MRKQRHSSQEHPRNARLVVYWLKSRAAQQWTNWLGGAINHMERHPKLTGRQQVICIRLSASQSRQCLLGKLNATDAWHAVCNVTEDLPPMDAMEQRFQDHSQNGFIGNGHLFQRQRAFRSLDGCHDRRIFCERVKGRVVVSNGTGYRPNPGQRQHAVV